ncbi:Uncharacterized protein Adt_27861 [Abeliophyllum distichum]|uniref:RING-type domain-containing protein n=1 Tax=Abeliophyllum distichum TaxID=126358 RepID=A0ABD1RWZ0_9LAMI
MEEMVKGGNMRSKPNTRTRVRLDNNDLDKWDEDYKVNIDEEFDELEDEYCSSLDEDELEESLGHKGVLGRTKNGFLKPKKRRIVQRNRKRVSVKEEEDDAIEVSSGGEDNNFSYQKPRKKAKSSYREEKEDDDYNHSEFEEDDEEFMPNEIDAADDEEDLPSTEKKKKKVGRLSKQKKGTAKVRKRRRNAKALKKTKRKRPIKNQGSRRKTRSPHGSSGYQYTMSKEEREQIREANEFCGSLTTALRSSCSSKMNEKEILPPQEKSSGRKGKEKAQNMKIEAGKQVCGICLSEEGKSTVRGTLNCCSHYFCFACIMEWSKVESRCPPLQAKVFEYQLNKMDEKFKLIPDIYPTQRDWTTKIIVTEKLAPKIAKQNQSRYQHMILMDLKGNKVQATLYDANINAFEDQLILGKTYLISNATVRDTKHEYRSLVGEKQWTITGRTRIEELPEDNMALIFSTYEFTAFDELEKYMDSNKDISIIALCIDMKPKRLIQTRSGNQTYVQDIIVINKSFQTMMLTMWDSYVDRECVLIAENIANKPVIVASHLKVSSFNGITLSTKTNSNFFINATFNEVAEYKAWADGNIDKLNEIIEEKPYLVLTPSKLSPPEESQFTTIKRVHSLLLGMTQPKHFWIKATASIKVMKQSFWYIACNNCNRVSNANLGETYQCVYCKCSQTKAVPREKAYVQLKDSTGVLNANVIGEPAEKLLHCSSDTLMQHSKRSTTNIHDAIQMAVDKQQIFYVKATQGLINKTEYKFEIIFVLDTCLAITQIEHSKLDKGKGLLYPDLPTEPALIEEVFPPPAKRELFQLLDEDTVAKKKIETNTNDPNLPSAQINIKPKSE